MSLIQQEAPEFAAEAVSPEGTIHLLKLTEYRGKYVVLFFYPLDFTFVCPTELVAVSERIAEFHERGAEVLGVSVDSVYSHLAWRSLPRREGGIGKITFPLISDLDKQISRSYGVLLEQPSVALRGTFLIDQQASYAASWSMTCRWVATLRRRCACWMPCTKWTSKATSAQPTGAQESKR